jgi:hypothetical protein
MKRTISIVCLSLAVLLAVVLAPAAEGSVGANGTTYVLSSFDGTTIAGVNDQGFTFSTLVASTTFKAANLGPYIPGDPYQPGDPYREACGRAAGEYNGALLVSTSDGGLLLNGALSTLTSLRCKARFVIQLIPNDPYNPGDPYVPPNPIKTFQPVP